MSSERKYCRAEEEAVRQALKAYGAAVLDRQRFCSHAVILEYVDDYYDHHRVCENCGKTATRRWSAPAELSGRAYQVDRAEYYDAIPRWRNEWKNVN